MGEIVNLRRIRRARDRAVRAEDAARNRAAFGRAREERSASDEERRRQGATLDAHRRDVPDDGPPG